MNQSIEKTRETSDFEREVLHYLNDLRESGVVNMFGAGDYIRTNFSVEKQESRVLLRLWMDNFDAEGDYQEVLIKSEA
jgi:hypothetical protein